MPQSTVSDNKTFLVKSVKLLWEHASGGGLGLVEDAEPSWWEKGDVLAGFPRPEQVRSWWEGDDGPPDPETPGRAGRPATGAEEGRKDGEKGDRGTPSRGPEAAGRVASDDGGVRADRPGDAGDRQTPGRENAVDERQDAPESGPTGATGAFGDREGENGGEGEDRYDEILAEKERLLGPGWESEPAGVLLGKLGWARDLYISAGARGGLPGDSAADGSSTERDPVAREVRYLAFWSAHTILTAAEMFERRREGEGAEEQRSVGWPATPREMHERLRTIAPALQGAHPSCEGFPVQKEYRIRIEYWEKAGREEGLWVFSRAYRGGVDDEEIEGLVWREVKRLEGLEEDDFEFDD